MGKEERNEHCLKKDLGLIATTALVVGMVIGSGIFMKPGKVIAAAGDSSLGLLAWGLGGIITLAAGLTIAELGAQIPKTGGLYAYLDEVYGKLWGYLFGWVQTLIYGPATIGALGLYFSSLLLPFFGFPESLKLPVAIAAVVFLAVINALGTKYGGLIQSLATAGKLIPIALIAVFGLIKGNGQVLGMASGAAETAGMGAAILATLWAYDGWIAVGFVAGEMKDPARQLPKAIVLGLGIVVTAYLSINVAILHVLPAAEVVGLGKYAAGTVAGTLFGEFGGRMISVGILVSIFGTLNGFILTSPRVPYAMALRGQLPASEWLSRTQAGCGTPVNAIILQMAIVILLMTLGDPDRLTDIAMFIIWVFYILGFLAVFTLRRRNPGLTRSYSVPGYPVVPLVAVAGAIYIVGSTLLGSPMDSIYSLLVTVAGVPVYWLMNRGSDKPGISVEGK